MSEVTRTTAKSYFNTGDTPTESQFGNLLDSVVMPATDAVFTALSGTAWDGSFKTKTLTANTALTFSSTKRSGILIVTQDATGGRTLSINGTSAPINTGANAKTIIGFQYNDSVSDYIFFLEKDIVGVTGGGGGGGGATLIYTKNFTDGAGWTVFGAVDYSATSAHFLTNSVLYKSGTFVVGAELKIVFRGVVNVTGNVKFVIGDGDTFNDFPPTDLVDGTNTFDHIITTGYHGSVITIYITTAGWEGFVEGIDVYQY